MKDIYTRTETEPKYNVDTLDEGSPLNIYIQKIKCLFFTDRISVIGAPEIGIDLESLLFNKSLSNNQISSLILAQISKFCGDYRQFKTEVKVTFYNKGHNEEAEIDIIINGQTYINIKNY